MVLVSISIIWTCDGFLWAYGLNQIGIPYRYLLEKLETDGGGTDSTYELSERKRVVARGWTRKTEIVDFYMYFCFEGGKERRGGEGRDVIGSFLSSIEFFYILHFFVNFSETRILTMLVPVNGSQTLAMIIFQGISSKKR